MGLFLRQLYKQKPQAWGPVSAVQASIFKNAEKNGIAPSIIEFAMPVMASFTDYSKNNFPIIKPSSGAPEIKSGLFTLDSSNKALSIGDSTLSPNSLRFASSEKFTLIVRGDFSGLNYGGYVIAQNTFLYISKRDTNGTIRFLVPNNSYIFTTKTYPASIATISGSWKIGDLRCYLNSELLGTGTTTNFWNEKTDEWAIGGPTFESVPNGKAIFDSLYIFSDVLTQNQIAYFSDNPYFLLQRVTPVYYSVPGGTPPTFNPLFLNAAQPTRVIQ